MFSARFCIYFRFRAAYNTSRGAQEGCTVRFTKMNGAGNDFILLDAIAEPFDESAAPALAARCATGGGLSVRTV